jgi:hypothetical protein
MAGEGGDARGSTERRRRALRTSLYEGAVDDFGGLKGSRRRRKKPALGGKWKAKPAERHVIASAPKVMRLAWQDVGAMWSWMQDKPRPQRIGSRECAWN